MTGFLERLGGTLIARRWLVLVAALGFAVFSVLFGASVVGQLTTSGYNDPSAESTRAESLLAAKYGVGDSNFLLLVKAPTGGVDDPAATRDGVALTKRLAAEHDVTDVVSYWTTGAAGLRSHDGSSALILARVTVDDTKMDSRSNALISAYSGKAGVLSVQVGGSGPVNAQADTQSQDDLIKGEAIAFPITLILQIIVFRGLVASFLPLLLGGFSVLGTLLALRLTVMFTPVSVFALNLTTALGVGLALDYSLFIITRYREELHDGKDPRAALLTTMRTAGKTVAFSAVTVSLAMAAMVVFPLDFLKSFAYAGVSVVLLTALAALTVLPALLAVLGRRVDALAVRRSKPAAPQTGLWYRLASGVMRRPVSVGLTLLIALTALGVPFLSANFGLSDDRVLPANASAHVVADAIRNDFDSQAQSALEVVAPAANPTQVGDYAAALSRVSGVVRVDAATGSYVAGRQVAAPSAASGQFVDPKGGAGTWLSVNTAIEPYSGAGEQLTKQVRAVPAPFQVMVGGPSADLVDTEHAISDRLWIAGAWIVLAMLVLLFLFTGSVVLPLQAIVLSLFSLTAMFGAMVYVFQQGHLRWLVGDFVVSGTLDTTIPVLMFCIAFGLSMDYQVLLLSRIKEEHELTGDNTRAVATGLQRTGPVITAAAAIVAIVFIGIGTSSISIIKMLGLGLALAVLVDSSLVRGVLVPSFMRISGGKANWWAPGVLKRVHQKIGLSEESGAAEPEPESVPAGKS